MKKFLTLFAFLVLPFFSAHADNWKMITDLRGSWKFKLGDHTEWAEKKFDDTKWASIFVPANWEDEGYPGYDGYAWYRKHFYVSTQYHNSPLYINLGSVDDVSEVYVNGHFVYFSGSFPPHYESSYNDELRFLVPEQYLEFNGENTIAVRVYDDGGNGGIYRGQPGVYEMTDYFYPDYTIAGVWKLNRGDNRRWADPSFDDGRWNKVLVPAYWETQGLKDYDGFGWYRLHFTVPERYCNEDVVLLVGKIDDADETYLNGERIGHTGIMTEGQQWGYDNDYAKLRVYTVRSGSFRANGDNVLAVRVYDGYRQGGIYDGPIGIATRSRYAQWRRQIERQSKDPIEMFFDFIDRTLK